MVEELEGLGAIVKRSDKVEDGGKDVEQKKGDTTNVYAQETL